MVKFPEVSLACGTALIIAEHVSFGAVLMGVAFIGAFAKWSIEIHMLRQSQETKRIIMTNVSDIVTNLLASMGSKYAASNQDNGTLH